MFRDSRFLAGLLLGLVLGGILSVLVLRQEQASGPSDASPSAAPPESSSGSYEIPKAVLPPVLAGTAIGEAVPQEPPTDPKDLEKTLRAAHETGDWLTFVEALERLGKADTLEADGMLVAILGDASIGFREPIADEFRFWLAGSDVEGAADAVRRRIEAKADAFGISEKEAARPWANLFAEHATPEGMIWIHEVLDDGEEWWNAWIAFAEAARPKTVALAREILQQPFHPFRSQPGPFGTSAHVEGAFTALLHSDLSEGMAAFEGELDRLRRGGGFRVPLTRLLPLYLKLVPQERLAHAVARVRDFLETGMGRKSGPAMFRTLKALEALEARGADAHEFRRLLAWPSTFLREVSERGGPTSEERDAWRNALTSLQFYDRLASAEAVEALEAALPHIPDEDVRVGVQRRIRQLRYLAQWRVDR